MSASPFLGWKPGTLHEARALLRAAVNYEGAKDTRKVKAPGGLVEGGRAITLAVEARPTQVRSQVERVARIALRRTREPRTCAKAADLITADLRRRGLPIR